MDPTVLEGLLNAIRDAVSGRRRNDDDVALPVFDPATSDNGAEGWCRSIEELSKEFGWSSIATVARAGKSLKGSALLWFESWEPSEGRTWENFRTDTIDLYPEKRNLSEKLSKAVQYNSDSADSYCEYAREKVRGTNFSSSQINSFFNELHIEHHLISTGTPRSNGQVERYVSTVTDILNTMCNKPSDWPNVLWKVQQSINTTLQKSTGFTPLRLLIGVKANIPPIQARLDDVLSDDDRQNSITLEADRELAKLRLLQIAAKFKQRFDATRRNNINISIGDIVYVSQDHRRHDK